MSVTLGCYKNATCACAGDKGGIGHGGDVQG